MNKLRVCLLSALLVCALLVTGAWAEEMIESDAYESSQQLLSELDEVFIPEEEEIPLWEGEISEDEEDGCANSFGQGEDYAVAAPAQYPDGFVIEDGVLVDYVGSGGDIVIPDGVVQIGEGVFSEIDDGWDTPITSIVFPEGMTSIGYCDHLYELRSVTIPESVKKIECFAFESCINLETITLSGNGLTTIEPYAFWNCGMETFSIPITVTSIGDAAFGHCLNLKSITIPNRVSRIEQNTFASSGLTSITIPSTVTYIDDEAFYSEGWYEELDLNSLTIYCTSGSTAEAYAKKHGIKYQLTDAHTHTPATVPGYPATCTAAGLTDGSHCSVCGAVLTAREKIEAKGHTYCAGAMIEAPSCVAAGKQVYNCFYCDAAILRETGAADPNAHVWCAGEVVQAPSCVTAAKQVFNCYFCDAAKIEDVGAANPAAHVWCRVGAAADGRTLYGCYFCDATKTE